jgi:hypothetical protein
MRSVEILHDTMGIHEKPGKPGEICQAKAMVVNPVGISKTQ